MKREMLIGQNQPAPVERTERCERCHFFEPDGVNGQAECRKKLPAAVPSMDLATGQTNILTYWPATRPDRWCGEYQMARTALS
jgi:hypothetical protein